MAEQIAYAEWCAIDRYDVSGVSSSFGAEASATLEECVTFPDATVTAPGVPYKRRHVGDESFQLSIAGYLDIAVNYPAFNSSLGASPVTTWGAGRALGSLVTMFVGKESKFVQGGAVAKLIPLTGDLMSDGLFMNGVLYEFGDKSATGTGTAQTTTAVAAGMNRVLHVHVVATTLSPTLTVTYETSEIGDFSDAVTRHTFTQFTSSYLVERAVKTSTVSDTHGRFKWTYGGTGTLTVRMSEGVA